VRPLLVLLVAASSLTLVPSGLADKTPAPLPSRSAAADAAARAFLPSVFGDGLVAGADFSLNLGEHAGARVVYYDPAARLLFFDRTVVKVVWGATSVDIAGTGMLNGKRVKFRVFAVDGGDLSNGIFTLSVNGGAVRGGSVSAGAVTIG
jgi:hypothetical protein